MQILKKECKKCKPIALKFWREFSKDFSAFGGLGFLVGLIALLLTYWRVDVESDHLTKIFIGFLSTYEYIAFLLLFSIIIFFSHTVNLPSITRLTDHLETRLFQICSSVLSFCLGFSFWLISGDECAENTLPDGYQLTWSLIQYNTLALSMAFMMAYFNATLTFRERLESGLMTILAVICAILYLKQ